MWVFEGKALIAGTGSDILIVFLLNFSLFSNVSHLPGPVGSIVLNPLR